MTVSAVGSPTTYGYYSSAPQTLNYTASAVGNLVVIVVNTYTSSTSTVWVSSISSTFADGFDWAVQSPNSTSHYHTELFYGVVTATGAQTFTISSAGGEQIYGACVQEFSTSLTGGYWTINNGVPGQLSAATSGNYPNTANAYFGSSGLPLHSSSVDQLWVGAINFYSSASSGGSTSGFTYTNWVGGGANQFVTGVNVNSSSMTTLPAWTQGSSAPASAVDAVFEYWIPTSTTVTAGGSSFTAWTLEGPQFGTSSTSVPTVKSFGNGGTYLFGSAQEYGNSSGFRGGSWFLLNTSGAMQAWTNSGWSSSGPANAPAYFAVGSDSNIWSQDSSTGAADKISPTTAAILASYGSGITLLTVLGPDNRVWGAGSTGLVAVNTSGTVTAYTSGLSVAIYGVAVGSDNNIWAFGSSNIYKVSTSGTVLNTYSSSAFSSTSSQPVLAADGNLWWTKSGTALYKITTSGTVTAVYSSGSVLGQCWLGGDGKLWFSIGSNSVMSSTTGGVTTTYNLGSPYLTQLIGGGTKGPDGATWFLMGSNPSYALNGLGYAFTLAGVAPATTSIVMIL